MNAADYDLLIVSDLHLSEGRDRFTNKISLNEDFFFDEEFARFLVYHANDFPGRRRWHLLINGDFLDFLQVISTAPDDEFDAFMTAANSGTNPLASHREQHQHPFGFGTGRYETAYKVWTIMAGHWVFFEALAEFIAQGNVVSIGRGNHDVEFFYPEVQITFREKLRRLYERKLVRTNARDRGERMSQYDLRVGDGLQFFDWFYYERGLLWVEHGNQYDELNTFKYWLCPLLPKSAGGEIDMPWGSFFVRYLFNRVETEEPFADNIKPSSAFISWFLKNHPSLALRFVFHTGRHMLAKMARAWRPIPEQEYAECSAAHRQRLAILANRADLPEQRLLDVDAKRAKSVMKEPQGTWKTIAQLARGGLILPVASFLILILAAGISLVELGMLATLAPTDLSFPSVTSILRWCALGLLIPVTFACIVVLVVFVVSVYSHPQKHVEADPLLGPATMLAEFLNVRYVVMGHTHDAALEKLGNEREYFNTGTWTKVFSEEERLIREENEFVFIQGLRQTDATVRLKLMKWIDGARESRLVKLFDRSPHPAPAEVRARAAVAGD